MWFLFFFNRFFASLASYVIKTYTWHKYHVHLEFQALQFSFLGGRLFFRNLRYQGQNETIRIHDGHLTWRYWLRRVKHIEFNTPWQETQDKANRSSPGVHEQARGSTSEEVGASQVPRNLPCRISIQIRGIEWYMYNRSAAYEAILTKAANESSSTNANLHNEGVIRSVSNLDFTKHTRKSISDGDRISFTRKEESSIRHHNNGLDEELQDVDSISTEDRPSTCSSSQARKETSKLPSFLNILPIHIECSKGAIVMGNQNTRSILVAKFDNAKGLLGARNARSIDKYKQLIDFEFGHSVVQLKENQSFKDNQVTEGIKKVRKEMTVKVSKFNHTNNIARQIRNFWTSLGGFLSFGKLNGSLDRDRKNVGGIARSPEYELEIPERRWLGLTRYLDEDDDLAEQERWKGIEYGRIPTIVDSPKLAVSIYWDVPGLVMAPNDILPQPDPKASEDINGEVPPEWGVDIRIFGGNIRYGPWADRQRADLQTIFFPTPYMDAVPEKRRLPGNTRVSTIFKLVIEIEEQVTLGIPTREESKDWKWKGRGNSQDQVNTRRKGKKGHVKHKKSKNSDPTPEFRSCGWLDVKLFPNATINFTMDLVAGGNGYTNQVEVDLPEFEISTSVNHGLFLRSTSQRISCDLSYPLKWNELHSWHIDLHALNPEIFLLRDHVFLLTDLINDWVSGPPGDFYTFVPFHYAINLQFDGFKLYLNANDKNIINNPADVGDNIFTMLYGQKLSAALNIPLRNLRPTRSQVSFDVKASDGGVEVFSPLWNTYRTFLDDSRIGRMDNLRVHGSYDYSTSTRPGMTDILILNLDGADLKLYLYGFFLRYLLNLKDNYFGENLHFRTMEEYQAQDTNQGESHKESHGTNVHVRLSNDLDVIMAIKVDEPCIMLPLHIYSASDSISMDISSLDLDLRFTNYYMDLAVTCSPIFISYSKPTSASQLTTKQRPSIQIFIDGLDISSHRLFGLPPTEPTYVCHWDFFVGPISGDCSDGAPEAMLQMLRSFSFSFTDSENTLMCPQAQMVHDLTFLRARIKPIKIGLQIHEVVILLSSDEIKICYHDFIGQLFSDQLTVSAPRLNIACVANGNVSLSERTSNHAVTPKGYMATTIYIKAVNQMRDFTPNRRLQQSHISQHDGRTHRVPWLTQAPEQPPLLDRSDRFSKHRAPAMPIPPIPRPVSDVNDGISDYLTTSSSSFPNLTHKNKFRRSSSMLSRQVGAKSSRAGIASMNSLKKPEPIGHELDLSPSIDQDPPLNRRRLELASSSPYKRPRFPLLDVKLDLSAMPFLEHDVSIDVARHDLSLPEVSEISYKDQGLDRSSYVVQLPNGLQAFCQSEAIHDFGELLLQRQKADPVSLLDALQVKVTRQQPLVSSQNQEKQKLTELRLWIPYLETRMIDVHPTEVGVISQQLHFDFALHRLLITGRSSKSHLNGDSPLSDTQSLLCASLNQVNSSITLIDGESLVKQADFKGTLNDAVFWMASGSSLSINMQFKTLDVITQALSASTMALLLQQTLKISQVANQSLSKIKDVKSPAIQSLVLFLSATGDQIIDPPFLTTSSYVLRSATVHPRTFDSWKMISRLRYIYQSLTDNLKDQAASQCMQESLTCPKDAPKRVLQCFEKRRIWDTTHLRESALIQEVYGSLKYSVDDRRTAQPPLKVKLTAGKITVRIGPHKRANEIIFDQFILGMTRNQTRQANTTLSAMIGMRQSIFEMHCNLAIFRTDSTIIQYLEAILEASKALPFRNSATRADKRTWNTFGFLYCLHIAISLKTIELSLQTSNLTSFSTINDLNSSMIFHPSADGKTFSNNAVINSRAMTTKLHSRSASIIRMNLATLSLLGSVDGHVDTSKSSILNFAVSCAQLSLEVLGTPLEILGMADRLIDEEIEDVMGLMKKIQSTAEHQQPSIASEEGNPMTVHMSLSLGMYTISFAVLPSLTYLISGQGLQALFSPIKNVPFRMAIEFDIRDHSHIIRKQLNDSPDDISTLPIPPIYGHFALLQDSNQSSGDFQATVEEIHLDASSVHAFMDAVSHREIANLFTTFTQQGALLQDRWKERFATTSEYSESSQSRAPTVYGGNVSLTGLVISTNVLKSANLAEGAQLRLNMGQAHLKATNRSLAVGRVFKIPDVGITFSGIGVELIRSKNSKPDPSGGFGLSLALKSTSEGNNQNELIRSYQILTNNLIVRIYSQTASILLDIIIHLQDSLKTIDVAKEVKGLRRLTRARLQNEIFAPNFTRADKQDTDDTKTLATSDARYSLKMMQSQIIWKTEAHTASHEVEDLILSVAKIDLTSKEENAARLLIEDFQLQLVPESKVVALRAANSALLPELLFNVAYLSTEVDRRLAFQAAGKSLDLQLTSEFILPASNLRRSMAVAVADVRTAITSWNAAATEGSRPRKRPLGKKRLASLLIDADFAGAIVHIQGRSASGRNSSGLGHIRGRSIPQRGPYGQLTSDNAISSTTLRSPGIALKFEYKDLGDNKPSLSAEFKVDASSNILYPTVVPLIMEISSSIKEVVGESDDHGKSGDVKSASPKLANDAEYPNQGANTIFGNCRLSLGLRICRQEFSLSCQPIARVAATAHFEAIYITVSTMHPVDQEQSFTLSALINRLQASVQHDYSRESTGSFDVESIILSMMSSKHMGVANGLTAILTSTPIKAVINAKQSHDFLLFRDIWIPSDMRHDDAPSTVPSTTDSQAFMIQHYEHVAAAGIFPWDATVSIARLEIQCDLGQSLGRSTFLINDCWISSKKTSDWEQNLCLGFQQARVDATGRMSGFVELLNFKMRTSIHWTAMAQKQSRAPLIQASLEFDRLAIKAAFDFEAFLIADATTSNFLMYNVRDGRQALGDQLVGVLEGGKVQVFCTPTSASQGLALYQTFERLIQEKRVAYETSLKDIEKFLYRKPITNNSVIWSTLKKADSIKAEGPATLPLQLQANVFVSLGAISLGAFPGTFFDNQIFKLEALGSSARFGAFSENDKLYSSLGMTLGQLRVALSVVPRPTAPKTVSEMTVEEIVASVAESRGGTILKVPRLVATMQTWQAPQSNQIDYIFGSSFQGKVDVGWNYSRISFLRGMWAAHTRALAQRWGKPLPPSALKITGGLQPEGEHGENSDERSGPAKITAVVNVPQSKFQYRALEPPVIETPQLRDMGEATPPLEWIGLQRERLPTLTHQIVIVSLLEVAKEVEDAYQKILGSF